FRMIIDPIGFKRAMLDAKHEYEVDMERSGWQPSPPIRAASGSGAAATGALPGAGSTGGGAPSGTPSTPGTPDAVRPASASAAAHKVNPDEVTRTLANLADLRDRGAISAEEYEAKKTDLLARL
ncbi:MAG: SHOCT domain-containing protein, partial [Candidatus Limnocylindrales bacterium]|nr:SHOCT domain-containing protein [Candidatus Limnocylindrales bacterium]